MKESNKPQANIKWQEGAPAPVGRAEHTAVWLNGIVYVGGGVETGNMTGSYTINCYDPIRNFWSSSINIPYCFFAIAKLSNKLLVAGGEDKNQKRADQIFVIDAGQLKHYSKMITARSFATAMGHQGMLIITGGVDDKYEKLSSTELFDSINGQWYICGDLPQPHSSLKSVIVNNSLYLLGGFNKEYKASLAVFTAPLDGLSTHQLKWNTHKDAPCCATAAISIQGTQLLLMGGREKIGYKFIPTSNIYKLNNFSNDHSWEAVGHIPSARNSPAAVITGSNRVIVIGGENDKYEYTNTVWIS